MSLHAKMDVAPVFFRGRMSKKDMQGRKNQLSLMPVPAAHSKSFGIHARVFAKFACSGRTLGGW